MKKIFFLPNSLFSPESEIMISTVLDQLDNKSKCIDIINCGGGFSCSVNPLAIGLICNICIKQSNKYYAILENDRKNRNYSLNRYIIYSSINRYRDYWSTNNTKSVKYKDFNSGYAALSTYIGFTRDYDPDLNLGYAKKLLNNFINSGNEFYDWIVDFIEAQEEKCEYYLFNGRLSNTRPALDAFRSRNLDFYCMELAGRDSRIIKYTNSSPHDISENTKLIEYTYLDYENEAVEIAELYYRSKINGAELNDVSYVGKQDSKKLPAGFDKSKKNITIFSSSEDEFRSLGQEWEIGFYKDQLSAVRSICNALEDDENIQIYFRVHPNVQGTPKKYKKLIEELSFRNLLIIPADSSISSYLLMLNSDIVVTFGSTIGIEAVYWGVPSVLVGNSMYKNLGSTYNPTSESELISYLKDDLRPLSKKSAVKMAVFFMKSGYTSRFFSGNKKVGFKINNEKINLDIIDKFIYITAKIFEKLYLKFNLF